MRYIVFLFAFLPVSSFAQSGELLDRIALREKVNNLEYGKNYDAIIALSNKVPEGRGLYLYSIMGDIAISWFEKGNLLNGFKWLRRAIQNQDFSSVENVKYVLAAYKLDSNATYKKILLDFDKLHERHAGNLNITMLAACMEIYYPNVRIRNIWMFADDSLNRTAADRIMQLSDSADLALFKDILRTKGHFPGISEVGISFTSAFNYIVTHFASAIDHDTLVSFIKEATLKGELPNWYGPRMLDKLEYDIGRPSIYAEFGNSDDFAKDGTHIYPVVKDVEYLDERRAEFLLPPLWKVTELEKCILPKGYSRETQKRNSKKTN